MMRASRRLSIFCSYLWCAGASLCVPTQDVAAQSSGFINVRVCNAGDVPLWVAAAVKEVFGSGYILDGWITVEPGGCGHVDRLVTGTIQWYRTVYTLVAWEGLGGVMGSASGSREWRGYTRATTRSFCINLPDQPKRIATLSEHQRCPEGWFLWPFTSVTTGDRDKYLNQTITFHPSAAAAVDRPFRTATREIVIENQCGHPVRVALLYYDATSGEWTTEWWWNYDPGERSYAAAGGARLRSGNVDDFYYYAESTDESGLVWRGDTEGESNGVRRDVAGESVVFRKRTDRSGPIDLVLTCK